MERDHTRWPANRGTLGSSRSGSASPSLQETLGTLILLHGNFPA